MEEHDLGIPDVATMQRAHDACTDPEVRAIIARAIANPSDQDAWEAAYTAITEANVRW